MAKWIIPANGKKYDIKAFFEKHDVVDWTKKVGYSNGDIVYIYCSAPEQRVRYKTIVENDALPPDQLMDDHEYWPDLKDFELSRTKEHVRLRLLQTFDSDKLGLKELKKHGLPIAPQGPFHLSEKLDAYLEEFSSDNENDYPDTLPEGKYYEGAVQSVLVNRYERNREAREKCIQAHGCKCMICGMDFGKKYGKLGHHFIHVHHIVPISHINTEYKVDPVKDLIPVCPNCHAMLHRKIGGKCVTVEGLKKIVAENQA